MVVIGLGFNVKMLAAFVVLPTFVLVYALGAPVPWRRRLLDLALAGVVVVAAALPWTLAYDLTPQAHRPFVGSSRQNSMVELAVGHNAIGRFVRPARPVRAAGMGGSVGGESAPVASSSAALPLQAEFSRAVARLFVLAPVGPLRLGDGQLAGQVAWLLPLALAGLVLGMGRVSLRRPLDPAHLALILWSGWALTYGVVYSYAGGIFHFYYLATLAPPLAALAGVGVARLWRRYREGGWRAGLLPAALLATAAWEVYVEWSALGGTRDPLTALFIGRGEGGVDWAWLHHALIGGALVAASALLLAVRRTRSGRARLLGAGALGVGLAALLVVPVAWALSSVLVRGVPVLPSADLYRLGPAYGTAEARARARDQEAALTRALIEFLRENRQGERYLVATSSTRLAAPIIIETGEAVMARGGFHGLDAIVTPEQLARLVETRQVRFAMLGDLSPISRRLGGEVAGQPVADWVRAHGALVDPRLWRSSERVSWRLAARRAGMELYDLRPDAGLVTPVPIQR